MFDLLRVHMGPEEFIAFRLLKDRVIKSPLQSDHYKLNKINNCCRKHEENYESIYHQD